MSKKDWASDIERSERISSIENLKHCRGKDCLYGDIPFSQCIYFLAHIARACPSAKVNDLRRETIAKILDVLSVALTLTQFERGKLSEIASRIIDPLDEVENEQA